LTFKRTPDSWVVRLDDRNIADNKDGIQKGVLFQGATDMMQHGIAITIANTDTFAAELILRLGCCGWTAILTTPHHNME
jgi:hypothetical protein